MRVPAEQIKVKEGFRVELLYSVPDDIVHHTWVCLCVDNKGRLITSDQNGRLYRMTPPALNAPATTLKLEMLPVDLGEAQGLVWHGDSLYVVVNHLTRYQSGLWRVWSSKNDDVLDAKLKLRGFKDVGIHYEHGPHAVLLAPDGQSLYVVCGNSVKLTELVSTAVPRCWGEDFLLPRIEDPMGFGSAGKPPCGCIYQTDFDGKNWKLISCGFRNTYDAAFNREGELFTADNDMEWDINLPWYRPTRVVHAVPGSDFGWRSGSGNESESYPDTLPPVLNMGTGAPSGVAFGYGTRFPARYQNALFVCDWCNGLLYAVHLKPRGSSYEGELEEFMSGAGLPLCDLIVNPGDGAIYFVTGGRGTTSALYRLTYVGNESVEPGLAPLDGANLRGRRRRIESLLGVNDPAAIGRVWAELGSEDRFIRYAARTVLEFQPPSLWQDRAIGEPDSRKLIEALLGLARVGAASLQPRILEAMERVDWKTLSDAAKIDYLRTYQVILTRMGRPSAIWQSRVSRRLNDWYPADSPQINVELCKLLSFFNDPNVVAKSLALLANAPSSQEQIDYLVSLRAVTAGWSMAQRKIYFNGFHAAAHHGGGQSFDGYLVRIRADALGTLTRQERTELRPILDPPIASATPGISVQPRPFVKEWNVSELYPLIHGAMNHRNFARGHRLFAEAGCIACHRFNNEGGPIGPDLTAVGARFAYRDLLESIIEPSKVIADQYADKIISLSDGNRLVGRVVGGDGEKLWLATSMFNPGEITEIDRATIKSVTRSNVSPMPTGLLDTLGKDEIFDLVAYLCSGGNQNSPTFSR